MSYLHSIAKHFLENIQERQAFLLEPNVSAKKVSKSTFFSAIFRKSLEEENRRAFLVNKNEMSVKQFRCDQLDLFIKKSERFSYFTPAVYYHHRTRTKENLSYLNCIILDFDLAKDGTKRKYTTDDVAYACLNEFDALPHYVYPTKTEGNYNAVYLINPMIGTKNSVYLYEAIVKRMAILTGADFASTDAAHIFRVPSDEIYNYQSSSEIYDIEDFSDVLHNQEINSLLEKERARYLRSNKVISFTEHQILNQKAVKMLLKAEFEHYRNHACFTIALLFYALQKSEEDALDFLTGEWFEKVNDERFSTRFTLKEVRDSVRSAYRGRYSGPSREWVEFLTGEAFYFNIYRSSYVKKADNERKYQRAEKVKEKLLEFIKDNQDKPLKRDYICSVLDIAGRTLSRQIKALQEENQITFESKPGKNGGYVFKYTVQDEFNVEINTKNTYKLEDYNLDKKRA
ncbi:TPA: HTH domain-containing protein [Bacillus cereus]